MTLEIQVLTWDRHKYAMCGFEPYNWIPIAYTINIYETYKGILCGQ